MSFRRGEINTPAHPPSKQSGGVHTTRSTLAVALIAAGLAPLEPSVRADVSLTQAHIAGTITFKADFVPDHMTVYAGNPLAEATRYGSQVEAVLQSTQVSSGQTITTWSYDLTVEAVLTTHYYVRPIAYQVINPPYTAERVPFPDYPLAPAAPLVVSPGATTPFDFSYTPVFVTGTVTATDMNASPLPLRGIYLNAFDATIDVIQPDCVGSINFCLSAPNVSTAGPGYRLYLKPGRSYALDSQAISLKEDGLGVGAYNAIEFNDGETLDASSKAGGDGITRDYSLTQKAEISGGLQLNVPAGWTVYNEGITVSGSTTATNTFFETFYPAPASLGSNYITRLMDFVDFSKPVSIAPNFQLSLDGSVGLIFPAQPMVVQSGEQKVLDFTNYAGQLVGTFSFFPPYRVTDAHQGIQVVGPSHANAYAPFTPNPVNGGSYLLLASAGTWSFWRFGWNFDLNDPNFTSSYFVNNYLPLADAEITGVTSIVTNDFLFNTALLKVFFTAPIGGVLSDPQLDATSQDPAAQLYETGHAAGLNQTDVTTGEARLVLRVSDPNTPMPFSVNPTAVVNGSRVTFGPFTVTPHPGEVIVVGVPANIHLSVSTPQAGDSADDCTFSVTGTAGGTVIASVTANGEALALSSAQLPGDPHRVSFGGTATAPGGTVTVVATDVNGATVAQTIDVVCTDPCAQDHTPPSVASSVTTPRLWPPNHDLIRVGFTALAEDACDAQPAIDVRVFSNEGDQEETGEGNFSPDAEAQASGTLRLRAERSGDGAGRVYLILTTATDAHQNAAWSCATVVVPHDNSKASITAVSAAAAAAQSSCQATGAPPEGYVPVGDGPVVGPKQ